MLIFDTTTWIALGAAVGSGTILLLLSVLAVVLLRTPPEPRTDVERLFRESDARFEQMLDELSRALERARAEGRQNHQLSGLASTIDLDVVTERVLDAARDLPGIDAAALVVHRVETEPLVATTGMTREEADRQPITAAPGAEPRAVAIAYRYAASGEPDPKLVRGSLVVPLVAGDEALGTLAVFWRGTDRQAADDELAALEELAASAGPAVENALRYRDATRLADLDALTGLHNRRFFHDTLAREAARAARYDRRLALLVFDVDDFKAINDRIGHLSGDTVLAQLAERVRTVVRSSDFACRVGGDEFAVVLPESALADAEQLYRRLQFAIGNRATGPTDRLHISAGVAELRPGDDPVSFFERADAALYRAKQAGKGRAIAANDRP